MKQKIINMLLFLSVIYSSFAQNYTVNGKITDTTGETLFGVNVIIKDLGKGTTSNEYGFYTLTLPKGNYSITFSYLGFNTAEQQINLASDLTLNIELKEQLTSLNEVVISSKEAKIRAKIRTPQMSVNQLSAKIIKQAPVVLGETDILKTITLLPGVTNSGEGSSGFNVRGGAADQNLILLDEATIYNTSHLFGFFSVFNTDAIKGIQLYKGGIPSKFGGRISSVLDIHQKDGNSKDFRIRGGVGLISSRVMAEGPLQKEKSSFLVAGRTSYVNLFLKLADESNRTSFYDLNTKISYEFNENNKLFLSGYFGRDNFNIDKVFENSYGNSSFNLRWNHLFNKKLFSNLSLIYSKYNYNLTFDAFGFEWVSDINNFNFKYDFDYALNNDLKFNFGTNLNYYKFNPGEIKKSNESSSVNDRKLDEKQALEPSIYAELSHNISDKISLRYGARLSSFFRTNEKVFIYENDQPIIFNSILGIYERTNSIGIETGKKVSFFGLEPRVSLAYKLSENTSFKASYQRMNQYIHLISNTNSATPLDIWTPSGTYIKPQQSNQYAIGFFKNINKTAYTLEIEGYFKDVANRLDYIDGAELIANNTIETEILSGEARSYGLELLLQKNKGRFTGWLSYTIAKSEQRVKGRTPIETGINNGEWYKTPYDRTHDLSFTGSYKLNDKWSFASNFIFQTGRPTNYPSGQYQFAVYTVPVFTARNQERLPAYHRLDISATLTPKKNKNRKWQGQWVFGVYNLYNRKNAASINFRRNSETLQNEAIKTYIFGVMPAITYNFKF